MQHLTDDWKALFTAWTPTGSRVICDPAPVGTDADFLCMSPRDRSEQLEALGFVSAGLPSFYTGNDNGQFRSWRRGEVNLITTPDLEFYERFRTATALARRFNLLDKGDRIALFQAVLYGVRVDDLHGELKGLEGLMPCN